SAHLAYISSTPAHLLPLTLSLHDALPIYERRPGAGDAPRVGRQAGLGGRPEGRVGGEPRPRGADRRAGQPGGHPGVRRAARGGADRKSTRLNSSHVKISYAVFCLKKKNSN